MMTRISTYFFLLAASVFLINNQHSVKAAQGSLSARKSLPQIILKTVFKTLNFDQPVFLTHAGDGTDRIFVVEKKGVIKVFSNEENPADFKTFLDIEYRVNSGKSESGLLGLAFHPKYPENGLFYVYYNYGNLYSRIAEFKVSANPDSADENSERAFLELEQPYSNHNGGQVSFGPDGYLYIGLGDGGSGGDPDGNGQNPKTLLGAILRIDVDSRTDSLQYGIPADNPFAGNTEGWREEIWAYGLRNPWRFSFDFTTGLLYAADVGQNKYEEIDIITKGGNYGWNIMEGMHCYSPSSGCDTSGLILPIWEYAHNTGYSITGGYVYRGNNPALVDLQGAYIYGDYVTKNIWALRYDGNRITENRLIAECPSNISSFGEDENKEIYVIGYDDGTIYRISDVKDTTSIREGQGSTFPFNYKVFPAYPNPANPSTHIRIVLQKTTIRTRINIYDLQGQIIRTIADTNLAKGEHIFKWDGNNQLGNTVSSGIYYFEVLVFDKQGPVFSESRKIVLLK